MNPTKPNAREAPSHAERTLLRAALWRDLAGLGLPRWAPTVAEVAANLAFAAQQSNTTRAMLEDLHQGNAVVAVALGAFDGDRSNAPVGGEMEHVLRHAIIGRIGGGTS